ncbi:glycoside hydrolase superfamily [Tirmania nivea]|nr:glycoside hydrolase superfamily [Tirmania nivea]
MRSFQSLPEEKAHFLSGVDVWRALAVPRLGIPQLKIGWTSWHSWPRGGTMVDGTTAALTPSAVSLASTWDVNVVAGIGHLLATEMRDKKADILLAPISERNFESDPFLGGKLASHYINAIQSHCIATTIKHFAANAQETRRFVVDQTMTERTLRELHLVPFQIVLWESNPWCVMASYSKINGVYASNNRRLLTDILRGEWGYDGMVMSDWFGINSICPRKNLVDAVNLGYMKESSLDTNVRRILEWIYKTGKYQYLAHNRQEHQAFLRKAASEGIVLLKNEKNLLPLKLDGVKQIAFIGPNSRQSVAAGGGSASLNPHYRQNPYDQFVKNVASEYPNLKNGEHGMYMENFDNMTLSGKPVHADHRKSTLLSCYDNLPKSFVPGKRYSYRATGLLTPKTSGKHTFSMGTCGPGRLLIDGKGLINMWNRTKDSERSEMFMAYASPEVRHDLEEVKNDLLGEAVQLAKESDIIVLVVRKNTEWESEAYDMKSMDLPGEHGQGQELGISLYNIPLGKISQSSSLLVTLPKQLENTSYFHNFLGENDKVTW